jgi:hypothetical protein
VAGATWYYLWLNDATASPRVARWYTAAQSRCGESTGACSVTLTLELAAGNGRWFVAAWNPEGTTWSPGMDFAIHPPRAAWSNALPASQRFQLVFKRGLLEVAVLDRETGLVWERSPRTYMVDWAGTFLNCAGAITANLLGWRLPTIEELASLVDPGAVLPALPPGHPFLNVSTLVAYWSATTDPTVAGNAAAYTVTFLDGAVQSGTAKTQIRGTWCVRGGHGADGVQ